MSGQATRRWLAWGALAAVVHLPPGWRLLHVAGADEDHTSLLGLWTLLDLFLVLVVSLAASRLHGRAWGGVALLAMA